MFVRLVRRLDWLTGNPFIGGREELVNRELTALRVYAPPGEALDK